MKTEAEMGMRRIVGQHRKLEEVEKDSSLETWEAAGSADTLLSDVWPPDL